MLALTELVLLPAGAKIKARLELSLEDKELILEGVIGVAEGMNPKLLESKLGAFLEEEAPARTPRKGRVAEQPLTAR